jgi:hypothetical protein
MRSAPRFWFWSHDIQPDQVAGLDMPGMRLRRLANYRRGPEATRRFAALYYDDDGALAPSRTWLIDVDADDVSERLEHLQAYPLDLDAVGHGMSVRFASVAAKL